MDKREEIIAKLMRQVSPGDRKKVANYMRGKGSLKAEDFIKYRDCIKEFEQKLQRGKQ